MDPHIERQIQILRRALRPLEAHSRRLPWASDFADGTPWKVESVSTERRLYRDRSAADKRDVVKVDLHNLDRRGATRAGRLVARTLADPASPVDYVRVIVGKGNRSSGKRVIAEAARRQFDCRETSPLRVTERTAGAEDGYYDFYNRSQYDFRGRPPSAPPQRRPPPVSARLRRAAEREDRAATIRFCAIAGAVLGTVFAPCVGTAIGWFVGKAIGQQIADG